MRYKAARAVAMAVAIGLSGFAMADEQAAAMPPAYEVSIPAGELTEALKVLAKQTSSDLVFRPEQVRGIRTEGVTGKLSAEQAVEVLLRGTTLQKNRDSKTGAILIAQPQSERPTASNDGETATSVRQLSGDAVASAKLDPARGVHLVQAQTNSASSDSIGSSVETTNEADPKPSEVEEILVTASRVARPGFIAPTPTTVLSAAELQLGGRTNVAAALNDLPQFRGTYSPTTTAGVTIAGTATADLRGIGSSRTLVLVNGQRQVVSNSHSDFDLNTIPFNLVKRVEVVTGGASAAWGSGAVAGVVNVLLDEEREGLELSAQRGQSLRNDAEEWNVNASYGSSFAEGRGHVLLSAEYVDNDGIGRRVDRKNVGRWQRLLNPDYTPTNGQPQFLLTPDVVYAVLSPGGVIPSGPLAGTAFGPGGVAQPFHYGSMRSGLYMSGGDGINTDDYGALMAPVERVNAFGRVAYDLTDTIRLSTTVTYSKVDSLSPIFPEVALLSIKRDNAFMPQSVLDDPRFVGQPGLTLGRGNADLGIVSIDTTRETLQGSLALDGRMGESLSWNVYYAHGESDIDENVLNMRVAKNFANSLDSVRDPITDEPICRIALTDPTTPCVPVDVFGEGSPSKAARDYFLGNSHLDMKSKLDVAAATLRGDPFSTWAGPVSVAAGLEYRRESVDSKVDPLSATKSFILLNPEGLKGGFSVREVFGEAVVPLAQGLPLLRSLEFNGAVRVSDYSSIGKVTSWKAGLIDEVFEGFKLRATRSRDIRAANLVEMFQASSVGTTTVTDPFTNAQVNIIQRGGGNPQLDPELADTLAVGFVYQPSAIPGLGLSLDYYDIDIDGAIATINAQDIVNRCFAGNSALCSRIVRDSSGAITDVFSDAVNLANYQTRGFDFEASYALAASRWFSRLPGQFDFRVLTNYVKDLSTNDGITRSEPVGQVGPPVTFGTPHWRGSMAASYSNDMFGANVRVRYVGGGDYVRGMSLNDNDVPSQTYIDLGFQYRLPFGGATRITLFGNVANVFDRDPPKLPNAALYDVIGRYYTLGVRAKL